MFECILRKIPKKKSEWTRQGETIVWGYGFALSRLPSRPQEGSGEECGRVSDWGFSEMRRLGFKKCFSMNTLFNSIGATLHTRRREEDRQRK